MPDYCYEELFSFSSDLMVVLDLDGRVVLANNALLRLLGRLEPDVVGQPLVQFSTTDDRLRLADALKRVSHGGPAERIEVRWIAINHDTVRCDYVLHPSSNGLYVLGVGRNLDAWYQSCNAICMEQQALEGLIEARTRDLKMANTELEAFNFSISHDLRAPLRAISGFSQALAEDYLYLLDDTGRDYLRRIKANCERMMTLIGYLLQLSRLSRQELLWTTVDLGQIADTIIADMQAADPHRTVIFSRTGDMLVRGDRTLLFQLLQNLLDNAWKFTSSRNTASIHFVAEVTHGQRVFSVRDNGVGFPISQRDRLFILFQQLHNPDEYGGLGVGLATAQRVVHRHKGQIWAESSEGRGASFYFTLHNGP